MSLFDTSVPPGPSGKKNGISATAAAGWLPPSDAAASARNSLHRVTRRPHSAVSHSNSERSTTNSRQRPPSACAYGSLQPATIPSRGTLYPAQVPASAMAALFIKVLNTNAVFRLNYNNRLIVRACAPPRQIFILQLQICLIRSSQTCSAQVFQRLNMWCESRLMAIII